MIFIYHIGRVIDVISGKGKSADNTVQAIVRMWDGNLLILKVANKIAGKIKKDNFVIIDYSPISDKSPYRKMTIVKILSNDKGEAIWDEFKREFSRRKEHKIPKKQMPYIR